MAAAKKSSRTKRTPPLKPKRSRTHVIADLSVNCVEYHIVKSGFTLEVDRADYGYDGSMQIFDSRGHFESGYCYIQLKATDNLSKLLKGQQISYSIGAQHWRLWAGEPFPVYLVIFDAQKEAGYWLYFQEYVEANGLDASKIKTASRTVHIPLKNKFTAKTPAKWRDQVVDVRDQIKVAHV